MAKILTDCGTEFTGAPFQSLLKNYSIEHLKTTPHHPRGNGLPERTVLTINTMLAKIVNRYASDWDVHLPKIAWAYNRTVQPSTGVSPYQLMFGREPNMASSTAIGKLAPEKFQLDNDYLSDSLVQQFYLDHAKRANEHAKIRQKHSFDQQHHVKLNRFSIGDRVLLYSPSTHTHKLDAMFTGPYVILDIRETNAYIRRVDQADARPQRVHFDRLSACYPELPNSYFSG